MTPEQEAVLRRNIDKMIAAGADDAEVAAYAESKGFNIKFSDNNQTAGKVAYPLVEGAAGLAALPNAILTGEMDLNSPLAPDRLAEMGYARDPLGVGAAIQQAGEAMPSAEDARRFLVDTVGLPEPVRAESGAGRMAQDIGAGVIQGAPFGVAGGVRGALMAGFGGGMGATFGAGARELNAPESVQTAAALIGGLIGGRGAGTARSIAQPTARKVMRDALRGLSRQEYTAARQVFDDARQIGSPVTWSEAINQVTGGRMKQLASAARVAEQSPGGSQVLAPVLAARPQANAAAMGAELNRFEPMPAGTLRSEVPFDLQTSARGAMREIQDARTQAVDPLYQTATSATVADVIGPRLDDWLAVMNRPSVRNAWTDAQRVLADRGQPVHQWIRQDADGNVIGIDDVPTARDIIEMDKALSTAIQRGRDPVTGKITEAATLGIGDARQALRDLARTIPGYDRARAAYGAISEQVVDPLSRTPIGRLADAPAEMTAQRGILSPLGRQETLDPPQIRQAVSLMRSQPGGDVAVRDWTKVNLQSVFDEASQNLTGGANEWGAAVFAKAIRGNAQQRANLQALIESLPQGHQRWQGFERMLEVFEAQGKRQPAGSLTAFNTEAIQGLKAGRFGVSMTDISPFKAKTAVSEAIDRWRYGANAEDLARLLTDPESAGQLMRLAMMNPRHRDAFNYVMGMLGTFAADRTEELTITPPGTLPQ